MECPGTGRNVPALPGGLARGCFGGVVGNLAALVMATVAVVLLATGLLRTCPLYRLLGICTNGDRSSGRRPVS